MKRAFRRPVADAEVEPIVSVVGAELRSGELCSPNVRPIADVLTDSSIWDAHPDGDRVVYSAPTEQTRLKLFLEFDEELERLVPTD